MTDDTWYVTQVGPKCPAGPGWQQVPPPVPGDQSQCVTVLYSVMSPSSKLHRNTATPDTSYRPSIADPLQWSSSQDIKFKQGHNDSSTHSFVYPSFSLAHLRILKDVRSLSRSAVISYGAGASGWARDQVPGSSHKSQHILVTGPTTCQFSDLGRQQHQQQVQPVVE